MFGGQVVDLGRVGPDVVQRPLGVVVGRAGPVEGDEFVAVPVVAAVAGHLAVLLGVGGGVLRVGEQRGEADAVRLLECDAAPLGGPLETGQFQQGGGDVGDVLVLGAQTGESCPSRAPFGQDSTNGTRTPPA